MNKINALQTLGAKDGFHHETSKIPIGRPTTMLWQAAAGFHNKISPKVHVPRVSYSWEHATHIPNGHPGIIKCLQTSFWHY